MRSQELKTRPLIFFGKTSTDIQWHILTRTQIRLCGKSRHVCPITRNDHPPIPMMCETCVQLYLATPDASLDDFRPPDLSYPVYGRSPRSNVWHRLRSASKVPRCNTMMAIIDITKLPTKICSNCREKDQNTDARLKALNLALWTLDKQSETTESAHDLAIRFAGRLIHRAHLAGMTDTFD